MPSYMILKDGTAVLYRRMRGSNSTGSRAAPPPLLDLSATEWERLTVQQREEWMRDSPEAATAGANERRKNVY